MDNLLSYCGLVDPKISASDKDLPVLGAQDFKCDSKMILSPICWGQKIYSVQTKTLKIENTSFPINLKDYVGV